MSESPTPPEGGEEKSNNTVRNIAIGCGGLLALTLLCVGAFVLYGLLRTNQDEAVYTEANAAYEAGDCDTALAGYIEIEEAFRLGENQFTEAAAAEAQVCNAYLTVASETDPAARLSGFRQFIGNYPDTPIADVALGDINSVLMTSAPADFVNTEFCTDVAFLTDPLGVDDPAAVMPPIMLACGDFLEENENYVAALDLYRAIFTAYPSSDAIEATGEAVALNLELCFDADLRGEVVPEGEAAGLGQFGADVLFTCADFARETEEYSAELDFLDELQGLYPNYRADEVEQLIATALVNFSAAAGGSDAIEQPEAFATDNANAVVLVENASPTGLRIVFSGDERRVEIVEPCTDCVEDVSSCERADLPSATYELPPGQWVVVVEATSDDVIPFSGTWELAGGFEYPNCFYIDPGP